MPPRRKPVKKKPGKKKSGIDSLLETGAEIAVTVLAQLIDRLWNSRPKPTARPKQSEAPPPKKPKPMAWWQILGIDQNASINEIKRAYRELMARSHPDKVAHLSPLLQEVAEQEAKKLNAAYEEALNHKNSKTGTGT